MMALDTPVFIFLSMWHNLFAIVHLVHLMSTKQHTAKHCIVYWNSSTGKSSGIVSAVTCMPFAMFISAK